LPEIIANTSPLQYLHQLGVLDVLPKLVTTITVPPAVQDELTAGRKLGLNLPDLQSLDWITIRRPSSFARFQWLLISAQVKGKCSHWRWKRPIRFVFLMTAWLVRLPKLCSFVSLGRSVS